MRDGLVAVYAVARLGDDIADENDGLERLQQLEYLDNIVDFFAEPDGHAVFLALQDTMIRYQLPADPFHRLFEAFRRDVLGNASPFTSSPGSLEKVHVQMSSWDDVYDYCNHSANPVGELVLRLSGDWNNDIATYSNALCTALQITNFLQDLHLDLLRGRMYIPNMPLNPLQSLQQASTALAEARDITQQLFSQGKKIIKVPSSFRLRCELRLIHAGGWRMLQKCDNRIFTERPTH